jgi:MFS family permease
LSAFVTFLPTFAVHQGLSPALAGSLIAVFGVMGIVSRIVLTPLGAKMRDESYLLFSLCLIAAIAVAITMQASSESHWQLWVGAIGMGLTAVATNAIAMSMLVRDNAFGVVTVASGFVSVAFFGGFAVGAPLYAYLAHYAQDLALPVPVPLAWWFLIGMLIIACRLAIALAGARRRHHLEIQHIAELTALKNELLTMKEQMCAIEIENEIKQL